VVKGYFAASLVLIVSRSLQIKQLFKVERGLKSAVRKIIKISRQSPGKPKSFLLVLVLKPGWVGQSET